MTLMTNAVALAAVTQHSFLSAERSLLEAIALAQEHGEHEAAEKVGRVLRLTRLAHREAQELADMIEPIIGGPALRSGGSADDKEPPEGGNP